MKFFILLALAAVALSSSAEKVKGRRSSLFNLPANAKVRAEDVEQFLRLQNDYDDVDVEPVAGELRQAASIDAQPAAVSADALKPDSSNGRLFLKKFLLFSNLFGNSNTQPIIPIIITGTNSGTTQTVTTTGTISGTGTITTSPASRAGGIETDDYLIGEEDVIDDQLGNGKASANKQQNVIKLKQGKGNQQGLSFVVPPKYLRYFQNNPNAVVVNPAVYNNGASKLRKVRLNNNGNVKRKRARSPARRFVPQQ